MLRAAFILTALAFSTSAFAADKPDVVVTKVSEFAGCTLFVAGMEKPGGADFHNIALDIGKDAKIDNLLVVFYPPHAKYLDGSALAVVSIKKEFKAPAVWLQNGKQPPWGTEKAGCVYVASDLYAEAEKNRESAKALFKGQKITLIGAAAKIEKGADKSVVSIVSSENAPAIRAIALDANQPDIKTLRINKGIVAQCEIASFDGKIITADKCMFFSLEK